MKKIATLLAAVLVTMTAAAQTLSIQTGQVTWLFPANQAGEMTWTDGETLTVMNKTFNVSDITAMTVDQTQVTDGTVGVSYDGTTANVTDGGDQRCTRQHRAERRPGRGDYLHTGRHIGRRRLLYGGLLQGHH